MLSNIKECYNTVFQAVNKKGNNGNVGKLLSQARVHVQRTRNSLYNGDV